MVAHSGSLMLLKVAKREASKDYYIVGGMRTTKFVLNNRLIDITNKESGKWRELLSGAGISSLNIAGAGVFTDQISERKIREIAFANKIASFQMTFGNGDTLEGAFVINHYERAGNVGEEEEYNISLESTGNIIYSIKAANDKSMVKTINQEVGDDQ